MKKILLLLIIFTSGINLAVAGCKDLTTANINTEQQLVALLQEVKFESSIRVTANRSELSSNLTNAGSVIMEIHNKSQRCNSQELSRALAIEKQATCIRTYVTLGQRIDQYKVNFNFYLDDKANRASQLRMSLAEAQRAINDLNKHAIQDATCSQFNELKLAAQKQINLAEKFIAKNS